MTYFKTFCNLLPNRDPGLDVGTRLKLSSPGMNFILIFRVSFSVNLISLCVEVSSFNHCLLN